VVRASRLHMDVACQVSQPHNVEEHCQVVIPGSVGETDGRSGVEVPYVKGLTSHYGPESWGDGREAGVQALTGGTASRVLSLENHNRDQGASAVQVGEGQHHAARFGEHSRALRGRRPRARVRNLPGGSREILELTGGRWAVGPRRELRRVRLR